MHIQSLIFSSWFAHPSRPPRFPFSVVLTPLLLGWLYQGTSDSGSGGRGAVPGQAGAGHTQTAERGGRCSAGAGQGNHQAAPSAASGKEGRRVPSWQRALARVPPSAWQELRLLSLGMFPPGQFVLGRKLRLTCSRWRGAVDTWARKKLVLRLCHGYLPGRHTLPSNENHSGGREGLFSLCTSALGNDLFWHAWVQIGTRSTTGLSLLTVQLHSQKCIPEYVSSCLSGWYISHMAPCSQCSLVAYLSSPQLLMVSLQMIMCKRYNVLHNLPCCFSMSSHELFMLSERENGLCPLQWRSSSR